MIRPVLAVLCLTALLAAANPPRVDIHGEPLPDGALARFGTFHFRIGRVSEWALSPAGKTLAVEDEKDLSLWDVETGRVLRVATPDNPPSICLRFSPDGKQLARLVNGQLYVLDAATGKELYRRDTPGDPQAVAFLPGADEVAILSADGHHVFVVDAADPGRFSVRELDEWVRVMSPSGRCFLGQSEFDWYLVDPKTGHIRCRLADTEKLSDPVLSVDDRRVCFATTAGRLVVFDAESGKKLDDVNAPAGWGEEDGPSVSAAVSPDSAVVYLSRRDRPTLRRDVRAGKWLDPLPVMPGGPLVPHPDGKRVLLLGDDGVLRRYDLRTLKEIPPPHGFDTARGGHVRRIGQPTRPVRPDGSGHVVRPAPRQAGSAALVGGRSAHRLRRRPRGDGVRCVDWEGDPRPARAGRGPAIHRPRRIRS
jgi:PQQ-like domain